METTKVATHEKRIHPRKPLSCDGELVDPVSGGATPVKILDISVGGVSFMLPEARAQDTSCLIRFPIGNLKVRGVIRIAYCAKHSLTDAYRIGAEFKGLEGQYLALIRQYIG